MTYAMGIDIGGTKVAIGLVNESGELLRKMVLPTNLDIPPLEMITQIGDAVQCLLDESSISIELLDGIGIGAPGPLDSINGRIACPPNLPNWTDVPITDTLKEKFPVPVILENDANAAAMAEKWIGAARDNRHFIYLTISTGIGAGLFLDGKLVSGSRGNAGDVGHIVIDPSYGTCTCGQNGCFEWIASGTAISRIGSQILGVEMSTKQVFEAYGEGNPQMCELIGKVFRNIGAGCVSLINLFDPEKIVIGGGVSQVGEPLFQAVRDYVSQYALNPAGRKTEIVPAGLSQHAGIIGAAALVILSKQEAGGI